MDTRFEARERSGGLDGFSGCENCRRRLVHRRAHCRAIDAQDQAALRRPQFRRRRDDHPDLNSHAEVLCGRGAGAARIPGDGNCDRALARRVERSSDGLDLRSHAHAAWPSSSLYVDRRSALRRGFFLPAESAGVVHGRPRGDLVRRNLHPLLYISHSLCPAALRARPRVDAELSRPLDAVCVARVVHNPRNDRGRRGARRLDASVPHDPAPGVLPDRNFLRRPAHRALHLAGGDGERAPRFHRAREQSAGAGRATRVAQPPVRDSARPATSSRASPAPFRPR